MRDFLQRVLPSEGDYIVTAIRKDGTAFDVVTKDLAGAVTAVQRLSTQPLNIFVAIGSFDKTRKAPKAKRALYLDLDAKDFGSKENAARELGIFLKATGFPQPSIIVDSGAGLHCYWPFLNDLDAGPWRALAGALKQKHNELGFKADNHCTSDASRILRVPTTLNYKYDPPLACQVLRNTGETFNPANLLRQLLPATTELNLPAPTKNLLPTSINDDLAGTGLEFERPEPDEVRRMLSHVQLPDGSECREIWTQMMRAVHDWSEGSDEGFEIIDEWSATQPRYKSSDDVRKTWDSWGKLGADFGRKPIRIGTLIKAAKDAGYEPPADPEPEQPLPADVEVSLEPTEASFRARVSSAINKVRGDACAAAQAAGKNRAPARDIEAILCNQFVYVKNQDTYYSLETRDLYTKESIRDIFTPDMPRNKSGIPQDPCEILRRSPKKIVVDSLGFHPGEGPLYTEHGKDYVNKYVQPESEVVPTAAEARLFADFVDYLFPRPEDQVFKKYWLQFLAHAVQRPGIKIATALLFISETYGIGKSTAACEIPRLLVGPDNTRIVSNEILERPFTGYLGEAHLLHLQEVHVNGHWNSSQIANRLKGIITDSTLNVHKKGKDDYDIPNRLLVTATSNYQDAMYINSNQERRWGIYELRPARGYSPEQHRAYFNLVHKFLRSTRAGGVLRFIFGRIDLSGFDPQNPPPITLAKQRMVRLSASEEEQVILDAMDVGTHPFHRDLFQVEDIRQLIHTETGKVVSSQKVAKMLAHVVPEAKTIRQLRQSGGKMLVQCWRNHTRWEKAPAHDVMKELTR